MKAIVLSAALLFIGLVSKADILVVYSQLNNGNCRISVQHAPEGSNHYTVVSYVDVIGPCHRSPGVYNAIIEVDPNSETGRAILKADPRANLKRIRAVDDSTFKTLQMKPATKNRAISNL